jgi:hypothetical protein
VEIEPNAGGRVREADPSGTIEFVNDSRGGSADLIDLRSRGGALVSPSFPVELTLETFDSEEPKIPVPDPASGFSRLLLIGDPCL